MVGPATPPDDRRADFLAYIASSLEDYRRRGQIGTHRVYANAYRKFRRYLEEEFGRETLPYGEIDVALLRGFKTFLTAACGNGPNTVNQALRRRGDPQERERPA